MAIQHFFLLVSCCLVWLSLVGAIKSPQFTDWYPWYGPQMQEILQRNCSREYDTYKTGNLTAIKELAQNSTGDLLPYLDAIPAETVVNCLLNALPEIMKAQMAAGSLLLSLVPTVFSVLGSNAAEVAFLSLVGRRPLLALCLTAGSPLVSPLRPSQYFEPMEFLKLHDQGAAGLQFPHYGWKGRTVVTILEYLIACAAIANVAHTGYDLGTRTAISISLDNVDLTNIWAFSFTIAIHVFTFLSLWLLVRTRLPKDEATSSPSYLRRIWHWTKLEFTPTAYRAPPDIVCKQKTVTFIVLSWFTECVTITQILYGTMIFSSVLFLTGSDAVVIIARYGASIACCRAILVFETTGLKQAYDAQRSKEELAHTYELVNKTVASGPPKHAYTWTTGIEIPAP